MTATAVLTVGASLGSFAFAATTTSLLSWWLADSGKHLDWDGSTKYGVAASTKIWNDYKSGVIRPDTPLIIEDVTISDVTSSGTLVWYARTLNRTSLLLPGKIQVCTNEMDTLTDATVRTYIIAHEFGHALGLDHNKSTDVMAPYMPQPTVLSANDKASYDAAYKKY